MEKNKLVVYTDGGCRGNDKSKENIGAWAAILQWGEHMKEISGFARNTTNNMMELSAVIEGLKAVKKNNIAIEIRSDSAYVVNAINQNWIQNWINNGWVTSGKKPVANRELWIQLYDLIQKFPFITFVKVKGHSTDQGNISVDKLVNITMDKAIRI